MVVTEHEQREACKYHFEEIDKWRVQTDRRLDESDDKMEKQGNSITALSTDMRHLTNSMEKLTTAIWGAVISFVIIGFGFIIWYIQTL